MASKHTNRLISEQSPYLLQHGNNPVDWYPWGEEAFTKAKEENKPIFLSIGYSTCHWCHVMAHESFEDEEVARLMNEAFISIKIDREERPDIDMVYMTVCQMMTGSGGWPLTILMTPDKEPFFAGTFIPKESMGGGRMGMAELIPQVQEIWSTNQDSLLNNAAQIKSALEEATSNVSGAALGVSELNGAFSQFRQRFDDRHGGFSTAPKFPSPHNLLFLLRYWKRSGDDKALEMVEKTLQSMRQGGIFDHLGFGFHRYSTDPQWLVPHFEKMLYDQALMVMACIETCQATGKIEYARTAGEIIEYVLRDMRSPEGGFYSAEDADSEGVEGKFYLWKLDEIKEVLSGTEAELAAVIFNVIKEGNYNSEVTGSLTGDNILHLNRTKAELAIELNMTEADLLTRAEEIRQKLFTSREKRIHPLKDDKILTDWNGLMIAALAKAARVLDKPEYTDAAVKAVDFIMEKLRTRDGRLLHRYRNGESAIAGNADDYSFLVQGLLELYETTFDTKYLKWALELNKTLLEHFWDDKEGGFFFISDDGENVLVRQKEISDGAKPSGNSVAMLNLLRLGRLTADTGLEEKAVRIGEAFSETVRQMPSVYAQLLCGVDFTAGPSYEVVIAGDSNGADTKEMVSAIHRFFLPNKVVILRPAEEESPDIDDVAGFARFNSAIEGKATAYVCLNYNCKLPVTDVTSMMEILEFPETGQPENDLEH